MGTTDKYSECIALLKANKNLILTGAPGTGKTYLSREIATAMGAEWEFVQFHPSYDYTDFVEGLRPTPPDSRGNIGFERKNGVFKEFCKRAMYKYSQPINQVEVFKVNDQTYEKEEFKTSYAQNLSPTMIEKAMEWVKTQNGATFTSNRSNTTFTLVILDDKLNVRIPKGGIKYVNPEGVKRYLATGEYNKQHQTYEPSVGEYIKKNCPFLSNNKVLNDTREVQTLKTEHFNHPDVLPLTQTVQPQPIASSQPTNDTKEASKPFVFIIDEINRGEISKIFGELFFSIDPGYRGKSGRVKTQYQNMITDKNDPFYEGFYVPENVYIIGTMNDIDRSVESMDFAMRRRFAWKEIKANENTGMLDSFGGLKNEIISKMNRLNNAIWNEETNEGIEGLSAAYHIGGAYFKKLELYDYENNLPEAYRQLWENHLRGVLFEYLRGSFNAADNLKKLEEVYYSKGRYE